MAQFALISDIHGNIPALEAVLRDIQRRGIETIYCLGDLIGKGPHGDVAVDMVRTHCQQVIKGNWDDFIGNETDDPSLLWHQHRLGSERLQYLAGLPYVIEFMMSGKWVRLFHASPRSVYERIQPWDDQEKRATLFHSSRRAAARESRTSPVTAISIMPITSIWTGERCLIPAASAIHLKCPRRLTSFWRESMEAKIPRR